MPGSSTSNNRATGVRRNLFHQHLSRRPTSTASVMPLKTRPESDPSGIVVRDQNGDIHIDDALLLRPDDHDVAHDEAREDDQDRQQRLRDAIRHYQRDKIRTPSEPAELLETVKASLKAKMTALAEDNWRYEAEDEIVTR